MDIKTAITDVLHMFKRTMNMPRKWKLYIERVPNRISVKEEQCLKWNE